MSFESFVEELHQRIEMKYLYVAVEYITLRMAEDSRYSKKDRLVVLSFAGVAKTVITTATRRLKMLNNGKGKDVPSEEIVVDSIRFVDPNMLFDDIRKANDCILKNTEKR